MSNHNPQQELFTNIHDEYAEHHSDIHSIKYLEKFIFEPLFSGLDLNHKRVIELACGSGFNSAYLQLKCPEVIVNGLDISQKACSDYEKITGRKAFVADLTRKIDEYPESKYDVVLVIGGIHHCVTDLRTTMENISSLLHEGGLLLMVEPNADYFLEKIRKIWYKFDKYFDASTEHALRHSQLVEIYGESWDVVDVKYLGGPAYFLILQSLILRIPSWLKRALSTPLFFLEKLYNKLPGVRPHPLFIARWRKK